MNIKEIEQQHNRAREWMADKISEYCKENGYKITCDKFKINRRTVWRILTEKKGIKFETLSIIYHKLFDK